jgi:transposase-like protein
VKKKISVSLKLKITIEAFKGDMTIGELVGRYEVFPAQIHRWKRQLLDLNRSTLYAPFKRLAEDTELANRIGEIYEATSQYGYRRIHAQLNREGKKINRKKVCSLWHWRPWVQFPSLAP